MQDHIDAQALLAALREAGLDATWEQTGGGVGTMFVGPWAHVAPEPDYPFAAVNIGPGSYYDNSLTTYELFVGQDASYDPTQSDARDKGFYDGSEVTIDTLVALVQSLRDSALAAWDADARIVRTVAP